MVLLALWIPTASSSSSVCVFDRGGKLDSTSNMNRGNGGHEFSLCSKEFRRLHLLPKPASSSSSLSGGYGAEYSEQLLGAKPKPKRRKIAGIDQDELLEPALLADPDSCFCEFKGLQIHHKICDAESEAQNMLPDGIVSQPMKELGIPMILLHGFGASVFSWSRVMKPLAQLTCSKVLAFDRPAFGLTTRVISFDQLSVDNKEKDFLNPYSIKFSALATLNFIDFLSAEKAILVGHSAGANVAVEAYFEAPDRVAALILVAPAILAPAFQQKVVKEKQFRSDEQTQGNNTSPKGNENPFIRFCSILSRICRYIVQAALYMVKQMVDLLSSLYKKALSAFLRSAIAVILIRFIMDKFGIFAVRNAWYDSKKLTDHDLQGYTKPLRAKDWEKALLEFTAAILTDSASVSKLATAKRLNEISCPVLIVTGDSDRLVPSWNARRLSQAIPGSCFQMIKNCGHIPHEEKVEEFLSVVANFLQIMFDGLQAQPLNPAT